MSKKRLAIIGNGLAASRLLDELLRRNAGTRFEIVVYGEESHGTYNRILLSRVLSGGDADEITVKPKSWYVERGVSFRPGVRVTKVDAVARRLSTSEETEEPYDICVFATGSSALVPPVTGLRQEDGTPREGIHVFRTIDDCIAIRAHARPGSSAVVVGGGLLGLEAAKALGDLGVHVTVLHRDPVLMNAQLDAPAGAILRNALEKMGLFIRTGTSMEGVIGNGHVEAVRLGTGEIIPADLVVFACGIVPRVDVAKASGVPVVRGISVNDRLATTVAGLYAVGECAEHAGVIYGFVQPIWEQCAVLADLLTGANPQARYLGSKIYARLKVAGVDVASFGAPDAELPSDEVVQVFEERRGVYRKLVIRDGKLIGAMLIGCGDAAPELVRVFDRAETVPPNRLDLLATGLSAGEGEREICNCNHVSESTILEAIAGGCDTLSAVCQNTRAGTGCGSCKGTVASLLAANARTVSV